MVLIMNRKKVIFLLVVLSFLISLASTSVFAATTDYMPEILKEFFKWLFFTLPEQARSGDEAFVIYFKLILWLLLFPIIFFGTNKIFPDSRRISGMVAGMFSLIAVIFIPKGILIFIFTEFSAVTSLILALAPVFIGIYIRRKIGEDHPLLRNGIMIIIGVILFAIGAYFTAAYLTGEGSKLFGALGTWASLFGAIAVGVGIFGFLSGVGYGGGGGGGTAKEEAKIEEKEEKKAEKEEKELEKAEKKEERTQKREIKRGLRKITKKAKKESAQILADLEAAEKYIDEFGHDKKAREEVIKALNKIPPTEHEISGQVKKLESLNQHLENQEAAAVQMFNIELNEAKRRKNATIAPKIKKAAEDKIREEFSLARNKFRAEQGIDNLLKQIENYNREFELAIKGCANALRAGRIDSAKDFLHKAIELEENVNKSFDTLLKYENYILALTKKEIKDIKFNEKTVKLKSGKKKKIISGIDINF